MPPALRPASRPLSSRSSSFDRPPSSTSRSSSRTETRAALAAELELRKAAREAKASSRGRARSSTGDDVRSAGKPLSSRARRSSADDVASSSAISTPSRGRPGTVRARPEPSKPKGGSSVARRPPPPVRASSGGSSGGTPSSRRGATGHQGSSGRLSTGVPPSRAGLASDGETDGETASPGSSPGAFSASSSGTSLDGPMAAGGVVPWNGVGSAAARTFVAGVHLWAYGVLGSRLNEEKQVEAAAPDPTAVPGCVFVDPAGLHHIQVRRSSRTHCLHYFKWPVKLPALNRKNDLFLFHALDVLFSGQPPGGPKNAHGAAGAIYSWLGIDTVLGRSVLPNMHYPRLVVDKTLTVLAFPVVRPWALQHDNFPADVVSAITAAGDAKYYSYSQPLGEPRHVIHVVGPDFSRKRDPGRPPYTRPEAVLGLAKAYASVLREFASCGQTGPLRLLPIRLQASIFDQNLPLLF